MRIKITAPSQCSYIQGGGGGFQKGERIIK